MQEITHTYLTNLKAIDEPQNISCGEGLVLRVSPKGKKVGICVMTRFQPRANASRMSPVLASSRHSA